MMGLRCAGPRGILRKRDNTDSVAESASMPHSQILASMALIRCHAKTPAVRMCVSECVGLLGFHAPLTMGRPPVVPYVLITPRGERETMPCHLCDKNIRQRKLRPVFTHVGLCSASVMVWLRHVNGIPRVPDK